MLVLACRECHWIACLKTIPPSSPRRLRRILCEQLASGSNLRLVIASPLSFLGTISPDNLGKLLSRQLIELLDRCRGWHGEVVQVRRLDRWFRSTPDKLGCDLQILSAIIKCEVIGLSHEIVQASTRNILADSRRTARHSERTV